MKKIVLSVVILSMLLSCKKESEVKLNSTQKTEEIAAFKPEMEENAIIYEANIRQYSPEGTFNAFAKDIPELKKLGVKILWVMPIFPISETKRKASGGADSKFASDMPKEEQAKYLGSYYAVSDFKKVNPEFGNIDDFRNLVKTAHKNGMYVILDWVPNHTGWDHEWIKEHPEFYTKNEKGEITHPAGTDWTDVADLDYSNQELRKTMLGDMTHWIKNENIDGFRCDVAGSVPTDFWQNTISKLRKEKNIFMLAEAWEPALLKGNKFDMCYGWDGHHVMNDIAQGKKTAKDWDSYIEKVTKDYENNDIIMNFITNHDENSWNGSEFERMGDAVETMTALSFMTPGMPLIYNGQEYGFKNRLKFFEKDVITKTRGKEWTVLEKLSKLKVDNPALNGGKNKANYLRIATSNDAKILAFERSKDKASIIYLANMTKSHQIATVSIEGNYSEYMTGNKMIFSKNQKLDLKPWQYYILVKE